MNAHQDPGGNILIVDDNARARESVADILRHAGHSARCCASAAEALSRKDLCEYDLIITDLRMPGMTGLDFIRELESRHLDAQIIMVTAHASVTTAVEAMRHGAFDYIEKPFGADQIESLVNRALGHGRSAAGKATMPSANPELAATLIGSSPVMRRLKERIQQVARTDETVLICGESGTGKELVARAVHIASRRAAGPMVSLNCPALSPQLMESELFGHERGAFTSADANRVGRFELADQGTIFLDEVTEIAPSLQAKLLRVLQERSFERVGASNTLRVDVRVVASTNRDLMREVREGRFREDLYFRLAVVPLSIPALRERREDLPELCEHFLRRAAQRMGREPAQLGADALTLFQEYNWPGNVRELENIITRATVLGTGESIHADELRPWLIGAATPTSHTPGAATTLGLVRQDGSSVVVDEADGVAVPAGTNLHDMERKLIEATLEQFDGHRERTAKALGIGVRTLTNKLRLYGYAPRAKSAGRAA
ncbi:MAG: hypothetical protein RIS70_1316 [Planctomycetota bacterium]